MSFISQNLKLPYIAPAQAQKHVTHNEALRALDAIVHLSLVSKNQTNPPTEPVEGTRYFIGAAPTGDWKNQTGKIAAYQDGTWAFYHPQTGWQAWVEDEAKTVVWDGFFWMENAGSSSTNYVSKTSITAQTMAGNLLISKANPELDFHDVGAPATNDTTRMTHSGSLFSVQTKATDIVFEKLGGGDLIGDIKIIKNGVSNTVFHQGNHATGNDDVRFGQLGLGGATADANNVLSVNGSAALFNNDGNGVQLKLNKAASGDTASLLFQTNWSARAEIGLTGNDDFHFKVSPDGNTFYDAIRIDKDNGKVGIGTSPSSQALRVGQQSDYSGIRISGFDNESSDYLDFHLGGILARMVTSKGQLRIGAAGAYQMHITSTQIRMFADVVANGDISVSDGNEVKFGTNFDFKMSYSDASDQFELRNSSGNKLLTIKRVGAKADFDFNNGGMWLDSLGNMGVGTITPTTKLHVNGPIRTGSFTVAILPSASTNGAGAIIYVSDETGGGVLAFSDGTDWRRITDRALVS